MHMGIPYSDCHMHMGIQHLTHPRMQMGITICMGWSPSFLNNPRMHMGIQICIRQSPYANGDTTTDSSLHVDGDLYMHTVIDLFQEWIPLCIWGSLYAYGNPHMHTGIQYPPHFCMHMGIAVCIRWSPYAYLNPHLHSGIHHMQIKQHKRSAGTLKDGYVHNVPLPWVPQIQSASHESIAHKAGVPIPGYLHVPRWIPTLPKLGSVLGFSQRILWPFSQ